MHTASSTTDAGGLEKRAPVPRAGRSYRNGELVDRSVERSGWCKSGDFDLSKGFSLWNDGRYRTVGFPLTLTFEDEGKVVFELMDAAD